MSLFKYSYHKKLTLGILLFCSSWTAFMLYAMPYVDQTDGDCSATPAHSYTYGFFIIPAYFLIFGYWIFLLFRNLELSKRLLIGLFYLLLFPAFLGFVITVLTLEVGVAEFVSKWNLYKTFYIHGCYNELQLKDQILFPVSAVFIGLALYFSSKDVGHDSVVL